MNQCSGAHHGDTLSSSDASSNDTVPLVEAHEVVHHVGRDPGARSCKRVSKGDGATKDVALVVREVQLSRDRQPLSGEGLVDVEKLPGI